MTGTVSEALREAATRLSATSDTARLDAELLMAHALGVSRSDLLLRHAREAVPPQFAVLIDRRAAREPVAHILGEQEFYGRTFRVTAATLIPRGDSEVLVEAALALSPPPARVLDLGTGSGALLLSVLADCAAEGVGTDRSAAALEVARENANRLDLVDRARFELRDWHEAGWADDLGRFGLVLCNPPYVESDAELDPDVRDYEPASALFAGAEGLDDYRALMPQLARLLTPDGVVIFEIGAGQADAVTALAEAEGYSATLRRDLAGRARALVMTRGLNR
ncbi:MAG: peptide chain release factor N(5)-glutamine methyltransferase [Pseudomonadota bacterium]|jgi:release factor glutamine methyltransferase|nr:peptide chain release factor N(5)-glutamine methyltransferase [Pseudomonadota bacterium]